jgi:hypothetical protein
MIKIQELGKTNDSTHPLIMCAYTNQAITAKQARVRLRFADIIRGFVELQNSVVNQILIFKDLIFQPN